MWEKTRLHYHALKSIPTKSIIQFPKKFLLYLLLRSRYEKLTVHDGKFVISSDLPPFPSGAFDRLIAAVKSSRGHEVIPIYASFSITNTCRYHCWHCYLDNLKEEDLSTQDAEEIVRRLQELGVCVIALTGGEPLLRNDICEIIASINPEKSSVVMFTTGYGLTKEKAESLKNAGLFAVMIGLEHTDKKIQDALRNFEGSSEHALEGIKNAKHAGLYVGLSTVATKQRIATGEIWEFLKFAENQGVDEVLILEPIPVGKIMSEHDVILSENERMQLIQLQRKVNKNDTHLKVLSYPYRESKQVMGCCAGYQYLHVSASGNICPCSFTPLSFGNARKEDIHVLWRRMNAIFNGPSTDCFMRHQYASLAPWLDNGFVAPEKSVVFCQNRKNQNVPLFYKRLGVR
jgi:MoaA/NifB/PqqE/SkfB family radical SAM enzyme